MRTHLLAIAAEPARVLLAAALATALAAACDAGSEPATTTPVTPVTPIQGPAASHNRIVGLYVGDGALPDGRPVRVELAADPNAYARGQLTVDGAAHPFDNVPYDLRTGVLKQGTSFVVPLGADSILVHGVPAASGWTRMDYRAVDGALTSFEVELTRALAPLGGDGELRVVDASADANVTRAPIVLAYMETRYAIPGPKLGDFSAHASPGPTTSTRRFSLLLEDLAFARDELMVGRRIAFPSTTAQLNYNEEQADSTIHQWTAVAGAVVFDAVDGEMVSQSGAPSDYGLYTFHFEDLALAPSNSTSDPLFVGATGTFTLEFSGTSTLGVKYLSR